MFHDLLNFLNEFWGRRHWPGKLLILVAILTPIGYFAAKPAYHRFAEWRRDRNMVLAAEALRAGRDIEARNLAYSVLLFRSEDIDCIRLTAKAMNRVGDPKRHDIARYLFHHPEATRDDRLWTWKVIARSFPLGVVVYDWSSLGGKSKEDPAFFLPLVDRLVENRRYGDAVKLFDSGDLSGETTTEIERRILKILVFCDTPGGVGDAQTHLTARIDRDAGDIAVLLPELDPVPMEKLDPRLGRALVGWLARQKNPGPAVSLAVARFQVAAAPENLAETTVSAMIRRWRESAPVDLARWLLRIGRPETALDVLPTDHADTAPLYRVRRDALAALKRWDGLLEILSAYEIPPSGIPKLEWHCDVTMVAMRLGNTPLQAEQWAACMTEARIKSADGAYLDLAGMARTAGLRPEAEEAMLEAIRTARGPLPFYSDLAPLIDSLYRQGRAMDMLMIATIYLPIEPGNPTILIHYSYLETILGQPDDNLAHRFLDPLLEQQPGNPTIRRIFALLDLLADEPSKAAETLLPVATDRKGINRVNRILYGIALFASGDPEGRIIAEAADWRSLMPAERVVFDQLFTAAEEKADPKVKAEAEALLQANAEAMAAAKARIDAIAEARARALPEAIARAEAMIHTRNRARTKARADAAAELKSRLEENSNAKPEFLRKKPGEPKN